jgi:uncharacterized protein (TIGR02246 family)
MIRIVLSAALLAALAQAPAHAQPANPRGDEAQIMSLEQAQASAWNAHDIARYAGLFSDDANVVNVLGWWWKSRAELNAKLAAAHRTAFRDSRMDIENVQVRFVSPTVAVAHVR